MTIKKPTTEQLDTAIAWLRSNEGDNGESERCAAVADWIEAVEGEAALFAAARAAGVTPATFRRRLEPPKPPKPKSDRLAKFAERRQEIALEWAHGATFAALGRKHGVGTARIKAMVDRQLRTYRRNRWDEEDTRENFLRWVSEWQK